MDPTVLVEPLTEERAARTLYRIELLRKIREQVGKLHHEGPSTNAARVEHLLGTSNVTKVEFLNHMFEALRVHKNS